MFTIITLIKTIFVEANNEFLLFIFGQENCLLHLHILMFFYNFTEFEETFFIFLSPFKAINILFISHVKKIITLLNKINKTNKIK